jgi:hypothetical protein
VKSLLEMVDLKAAGEVEAASTKFIQARRSAPRSHHAKDNKSMDAIDGTLRALKADDGEKYLTDV